MALWDNPKDVKKITCRRCGSRALRAHYRIFPMWLCENDSCGHVWGFWSFALNFHFDGEFTVNEPEVDDNLMAVATRCFETGKVVTGSVDRSGKLTITEHESG